MTRTNKSIDDEVLIEKLREIILREDRESFAALEDTINDPEKLSQKVEPIIEARIDFLRNNFPKEYEATVNKIVASKMESYKKEVLDEIYPNLGKMIKKYITLQFDLLKERIDDGVKSTFSPKGIKQRFKAMFYGVDESEFILSKMIEASIEEVYIIQRNSGLLIGSASRNETIDKDVIAGMLTAIKSFVEDAFKKEREDLEMIQYGSYKIFLQNFHSFYMAIALSGSISNSEKEKLTALTNEFVEKELKLISNDNVGEKSTLISEKLNEFFIQKK